MAASNGVVAGRRIVVTGVSAAWGEPFAAAPAAEERPGGGERHERRRSSTSLVAEITGDGGTAVAAVGSVADDAVAEQLVATCPESSAGSTRW